MQNSQPSLLARDDTMFGVCQAIGDDFGFNPLYLRALLAGLVLWNPVAVLSAYAAGAVLVFASRWLYPAARRTDAVHQAEAPALQGENDAEEIALPIAA